MQILVTNNTFKKIINCGEHRLPYYHPDLVHLCCNHQSSPTIIIFFLQVIQGWPLGRSFLSNETWWGSSYKEQNISMYKIPMRYLSTLVIENWPNMVTLRLLKITIFTTRWSHPCSWEFLPLDGVTLLALIVGHSVEKYLFLSNQPEKDMYYHFNDHGHVFIKIFGCQTFLVQ